MTRIVSIVLMGTLIFSILPKGYTQSSDTIEAKNQAKADFQEGTWTVLGMIGAMGCCIGYAIGSTIDPEPDVSYWITMKFVGPNDTQTTGAYIGTAAGCLSLPLALVLAPINPSPARLLGKTPEYVEAYTQKYKSETQILRLKHVGKGLALGTGLGCLIGFIVAQSY